MSERLTRRQEELAEKYALACVKRDAFKAGLLRAEAILATQRVNCPCDDMCGGCIALDAAETLIESEAAKIEGE